MKIQKLVLINLIVLLCVTCSKNGGSSSKKNAGPASQSTAALIEGGQIILKIGEKQFTNNDFKKFLQVSYPDIAKSTEKEIKHSLLSRLFDTFLEQKMILYTAEQKPIPLSDQDVDQYMNKLKVNIPQAKIDRRAVEEGLKVQKYLYYNVFDQIKVNEEEIRNYYNQYKDEFQKKAEVLLYQILVKDKETAVRIRGILKNNPQQFEEIAKKESISMEAGSGGQMGYFEKGTLPKDMEDVVFSLQPNSISPVVESSYGFHIFKITQKKKERLLYLDKAKPLIENKLMSDKLGAAYRNFVNQTRNRLKITIEYNRLFFKYKKNVEGEDQNQGVSDEKQSTTHSNNNNPGNS